MNAPSFEKFRQDYRTLHVGLRRAVCEAIRRFRDVYEFDGDYDLNEKYQIMFTEFDAAIDIRMLLEPNKDKHGNPVYQRLVENWGKTDEIGKSLGNRNKALFVFYYLSYYLYQKDNPETLDTSYADNIRNGLSTSRAEEIKRAILFAKDNVQEPGGNSDEIRKNSRNVTQFETEIQKSGRDRKSSIITFVNKTTDSVSVFWLDFAGIENYYFDIEANGKFGQATSISHSWVVRYAISGQKICVVTAMHREEVFQITDDMIDDNL